MPIIQYVCTVRRYRNFFYVYSTVSLLILRELEMEKKKVLKSFLHELFERVLLIVQKKGYVGTLNTCLMFVVVLIFWFGMIPYGTYVP